MAFLRQLKLLLWKNFALRKRQPVRVIVELLWPLILFLILMWVRLDNADLKQRVPECHYDIKAMPSAGFLPFVQSLFCNANNTCHATERLTEMPAVVDGFNTSIITMVVKSLERLLSNSSVTDSIVEVATELSTLEDFIQRLTLAIDSSCKIKLMDILDNTFDAKATAQNVNITSDQLLQILNSPVKTSQVSTALTEYMTSFRKRQYTATNVTELMANELCQPGQLILRLFTLPASDTAWISQLCTSSPQAFGLIVAEIYNHVDTAKIRSQAAWCSTKVAFWNPSLALEGWRLYDQVSNLRPVIAEVNRTYIEIKDMFEMYNVTAGNMNSTAAGMNRTGLQMVRMFLCPYDPDLLEQPEQQQQQRTRMENPFGDQGFNPATNDYNSTVDVKHDANYAYDNTTSEFCNNVLRSFETSSSDAVRIVWRQMKPFVRGKIPYTPNLPAIQAVLSRANATFNSLAYLSTLASDWLQVSPYVESYLNSSQQVESIRTLIEVFSMQYSNITWLKGLSNFMRNDDSSSEQLNWKSSLDMLQDAMTTVQQYVECIALNKFEPYETEDALVNASVKYVENQALLAALVFDLRNTSNDSSVPPYISYKIRMDVDRVDSTHKYKVLDRYSRRPDSSMQFLLLRFPAWYFEVAQTICFARYWTPHARARPIPDMKYIVYGFAYLQDMIEHAIINERTGSDDIGVVLQQFPYPCYIRDRFVMAISRTMPLFMTLAWIFTASMIVKGIVYEKERRLKEVMKVMGLGNSVHWVSWFMTSFAMMLISILLLVAVLKGGAVIEFSDASVLFVFLLAFSVATITQCFMFSVFFSRANLAAACAAIFYYIGYLPYAFVVQWEEYLLNWHKASLCLSSTVAFGFGCSYFARYEEMGSGMQWSTLATSPIPEDGFSLAHCIMMMLMDSCAYMAIAWYVEAVFPGEYGVPKPWYFLFTKAYWCGNMLQPDSTEVRSANIELSCNQSGSEAFENEPEHLPVGVAIHKLRKVYANGNKTAVNGLSLNFYEGHITSFLGHNGAGKTTTMSILTGLYPPTAGTALIYGKDVRYEMDKIRQNMGMCPQHNVLFDSLTVAEHLYFYGQLKGLDAADAEKEVQQMIVDVGLPHKKNALARDLSGGMQRKLSIAVAFTAGSRVVILDEPTAGVDPYARRSIWDLLLRYKAGRTIILSTHFMDEADMLGDRIAIISHGQLMCCGSSLFLKRRFGSGYYLTVAVADDKKEETSAAANVLSSVTSVGSRRPSPSQPVASPEETTTVSSNNVEATTTKFIQNHIPDAVLVDSFATEVTYQLPDDIGSVAKFDQLFTDLDQNLMNLGISSYGISNTSLEEVFLKVANMSGVDEDEHDGGQFMFGGGCPDNSQGGRTTMGAKLQNAWRKFRGFFGAGCRKKSLTVNKVLDDDDEIIDITECDSDVPLINSSLSEEIYEESSRNQNGPADGVVAANGASRCNGAGTYRVTGIMLLIRQFQAMFVKRFHYVRRSKKAFLSQIILPALFICIAMIFAKLNPPEPQLPAMEIHPWLHVPQKLSDNNLRFFYSNGPTGMSDTPEWILRLEKMLFTTPGIGTRCMDPSVHSIDGFSCVESVDTVWTNATSVRNDTCSCEAGFMQCPAAVEESSPSWRQLPTTDIILNMTEWNITDWLVKTTWHYKKRRYGGLSFGEQNVDNLTSVGGVQIKDFAGKLIELARSRVFTWNGTNITMASLIHDVREFAAQLYKRKLVKVWFDNTGYVSTVAYMNAVNNMLLRANLSSSEDARKTGFTVFNHPMNRTSKQMARYTLLASAVDVLVSISVIFAMSQIPASFIVFLVEERQSGSKHLQFVSGVSPAVFWIANFVWDICNYLVSTVVCIFLFMAFQQRQYVSADNAPCLISLLILYGWAITPMMYPMSYVFKVPSTAFVVTGCANIFLGLLSTLSTFILELFQEERLDRINDILRRVFLLLPHFCLGRGLIDMTRNQLMSDVFESLGGNRFENPFSWDLVGANLFSLACLGLFFFVLVVCMEYKFWVHKIPCFNKCRYTAGQEWQMTSEVDEDVDVANERARIESRSNSDNDVLVLEGITKRYHSHLWRKRPPAVDNISVGVHRGECFGLLGVNGAGKTTTFKMLTGDIKVSAGDASLDGYSIHDNMIEVRRRLGYCPQFSALYPLLSATEHLAFYARLRGVPEKDVPMVVKWAVRRLGLIRHANKRAGDLSGGNQRKLSTAIALVGNPSVIYLDEPTTGMDPKARRFLWNCIGDIVKDGRSVVLTSHSMEECEVLCNRIAVMVNGTFKCLGSVQHLKSRFGDGYTVCIRTAAGGSQPQLSQLKQFIAESFAGAQLKEEHFNVVHYQLPATGSTLAQIFRLLEKARTEFSIEDYSVSQTTLEQVFLNFAKQQTDLLNDEMAAAANVQC